MGIPFAWKFSALFLTLRWKYPTFAPEGIRKARKHPPKTALRHEHRRGNQIQGHRDRRRDLLFQCFRHGHPQSGGVQRPQDHTSRTTQHEPWQFRGGRQQVFMRPRLRRHLEESPDLRSHLGGDHRKVEKED